MSQPFVGEIRMVGFNFPPVGWALCDGSLLAISENTVLFELIGTTYGGDGQNTFALPDLRGRLPFHQGPGFVIGQVGGTETVTLTTSQIPAHTHQVAGASLATSASPAGAVPAVWGDGEYSTAATNGALAPAAVGGSGGSQPHDNLSPFLVINFAISLFGIFPTQA